MNYFGLNLLRLPTRLLSFCLLGVAFAAIVYSIGLLVSVQVFAFWGLFWLGPGGAVILGGAALTVGYVGARKEIGPGIFTVFSGIVSIAASAMVNYLIFGDLIRNYDKPGGLDLTAAKMVIVGT